MINPFTGKQITLNNSPTSEKHDGPTPNGGDRSVIFYLNDKWETARKDFATKAFIIEYKNGKQIHRTYADLVDRTDNALDPCGQESDGKFTKGNVCAIGGGTVSQRLRSSKSYQQAVDLLSKKTKTGWSRDLFPDSIVAQRLEPTKMTTSRVDGVILAYPKDLEHRAKRFVHEVATRSEYPKSLVRANKAIVFWDEANPDDDYWSRKYGRKFVTNATGGLGSIDFYRYGVPNPGTYVHESAHNLAKQLWGQYEPPKDSSLAMMLEVLSFHNAHDHINSSNAEKFAHLASMYVLHPDDTYKLVPKVVLEEMSKVLGVEYSAKTSHRPFQYYE